MPKRGLNHGPDTPAGALAVDSPHKAETVAVVLGYTPIQQAADELSERANRVPSTVDPHICQEV